MAGRLPIIQESPLHFTLEKRGLRPFSSAVSSRILALTVFFSFTGSLPAADCTGTSVGFLPLNDLGTGVYQGFQGGLYPGGSDVRPAAHDEALDRVGRVMLLDPQGLPDAASGKNISNR